MQAKAAAKGSDKKQWQKSVKAKSMAKSKICWCPEFLNSAVGHIPNGVLTN